MRATMVSDLSQAILMAKQAFQLKAQKPPGKMVVSVQQWDALYDELFDMLNHSAQITKANEKREFQLYGITTAKSKCSCGECEYGL